MGHANGFRIGKHLEYFESIEDDYVVNYIMGGQSLKIW